MEPAGENDMGETEFELVAPRGVSVTRRFERSRLEGELYQAVYEVLLVQSRPASVAAQPRRARLRARLVNAGEHEAREPHGTGKRVAAVQA
jgi:hypothetical protein